jgi:hypothetical protein
VIEVVPGGTGAETRQQDKDLPPCRGKKLPRPPLVSPEKSAQAIVRNLQRQASRVVYTATSLLPLELPATGRLIRCLAAGIIDEGFGGPRDA